MMMNDMMLDELLTQWKTERAPAPGSFSSQECFENKFFARLLAEKNQARPKGGPTKSAGKEFRDGSQKDGLRSSSESPRGSSTENAPE